MRKGGNWFPTCKGPSKDNAGRQVKGRKRKIIRKVIAIRNLFTGYKIAVEH